MNLHEEKDTFRDLVTATAETLGIEATIVEKDYYVTAVLKELTSRIPDMVFKGGTSLSKCYKLINRFSEDIDISYTMESGKPGESRRRKLKKAVNESIEAIGLNIDNITDIRSRRDYNCYRAPFTSLYSGFFAIDSVLIVETYVALLPYPNQSKLVHNYIHDFLCKVDQEDIAIKYDLKPFEITTQSIDRTFIDKVFAICDYYMDNKVDKHSRHLYDINKIYNSGDLSNNDELHKLITDVKESRKILDVCPSAKDGININDILKKIVLENAYEDDYGVITEKILFSPLEYSEAIKTIKEIINSGLFLDI